MRLLLAALLLLSVSACGGSDPPGYAGAVRDPAPAVDAEPLPDVARSGEPSTLRAEAGGVLLVYFGYTYCPDVCPLTMSDVKAALRNLDTDERARVRVAMITVDPDRDTADVLTRYVHAFVPDGIALRSEDTALVERVAGRFGASFSVERNAEGEIEVSHTAFVYAVDSQGLLRLQWPFGTRPETFRDDLRTLMRSFENGSASSSAAPERKD